MYLRQSTQYFFTYTYIFQAQIFFNRAAIFNIYLTIQTKCSFCDKSLGIGFVFHLYVQLWILFSISWTGFFLTFVTANPDYTYDILKYRIMMGIQAQTCHPLALPYNHFIIIITQTLHYGIKWLCDVVSWQKCLRAFVAKII